MNKRKKICGNNRYVLPFTVVILSVLAVCEDHSQCRHYQRQKCPFSKSLPHKMPEVIPTKIFSTNYHRLRSTNLSPMRLIVMLKHDIKWRKQKELGCCCFQLKGQKLYGPVPQARFLQGAPRTQVPLGSLLCTASGQLFMAKELGR